MGKFFPIYRKSFPYKQAKFLPIYRQKGRSRQETSSIVPFVMTYAIALSLSVNWLFFLAAALT